MTETEDYEKTATPTAHKTSHQDGGSDEISVQGLSGLLADGQTPLAHKTSHEDWGTDEISVASLSGELADNQKSTWDKVSGKPTTFTPAAHKTTHEKSGDDEISVLNLSGLLADPQTPLILPNWILTNFAKGQLIAAIYSIVTPANIKGLWIFDPTAAVSIINDRSGLTHPLTLRDATLNAINASTCTPGLMGLSPFLTMDATHLWNTPDHSDFSFAGAFSIVVLGSFVDATSSTLVGKHYPAISQGEWAFWTSAADKIYFALFSPDVTKIIGRYYDTAITSHEGAWRTYIATHNGGVLATGLKIYSNAARIDDTSLITGVYAGMTNGTALPANYLSALASPSKMKYGVILIVAEELTQTQVNLIDYLLRSYANDTLN